MFVRIARAKKKLKSIYMWLLVVCVFVHACDETAFNVFFMKLRTNPIEWTGQKFGQVCPFKFCM